MKHLTHWVLALLTVGAASGLCGAWSATPEQEPPKQEKGGAGAAQKRSKGQARMDKLGTLKKIVPTLKMSLVEAIALAEKETAGKAIAAGLEVAGGKAMFQVTLLLNDEMRTASVNTETSKVVLQDPLGNEGDGVKVKKPKKEKGAEGGEDGDEGEDGEEGG